jgi:hypothetical protein
LPPFEVRPGKSRSVRVARIAIACALRSETWSPDPSHASSIPSEASCQLDAIRHGHRVAATDCGDRLVLRASMPQSRAIR